MVPSRKDKERHLARFLDIFKKLEITLPFGEALQQMALYAKILKDMLTKKNRYIHSDCRNLPFCGRARRGSRVRLP